MKFDVITIDWPWDFDVYNKDSGRGRSAAAHYDVDSLSWEDWKWFIQYLWPLMPDNCALPIWMVRPSQNQAMSHVDNWWNMWIAHREGHYDPIGVPLSGPLPPWAKMPNGFTWFRDGWPKKQNEAGFPMPRSKDTIRYKTELFTLYKKYRDGTPFVAGGYYSRSNTEPCMLYIRGSMPRVHRGVRQPIDYVPHDLQIPKKQRHSYKPPEYRRRIEQLWGPRPESMGKGPSYPDMQYLELFAREDAKEANWTYLGGEIDKRDIRESLSALA